MPNKSMFDNFPQPEGYIPDNRHKCLHIFKLDIMAGESATHTFEVPFNVTDNCDSVEVIYKLGVNVILTKVVNQEDINDDDNIVSVKLTPDETKLFANTYLDALVQLKFLIKDGSTLYKDGATLYSEIYKIKVIDALDVGNQGDLEN